ncbi:MAG: LCP family protein [Acidimicrobiia bacterium]
MLIVVGVLVVLGLLGGFLWLRSVWNRIDRVEVSHVLSSGGEGTNYLIVGSDARPEGEEGPAGQRSDTIMLLHLEGDESLIMSIPRDLYVEIPSRGGSSKINAAYNDGPAALVETVTQTLRIPVHRYMEVDFVSFGGLVDGLGGVTVTFDNPAYDERSGLFVPEAGAVELDGEQALAYVRSRRYTEVIDGTERTDPRGDLGRVERQQEFLTAVASKLGNTRNPLALARAGSGAAGGLRIDDAMSMLDGLRFVWAMRGLDPEQVELPVDSGNNESGSVLFLRESEASAVLDRVR